MDRPTEPKRGLPGRRREGARRWYLLIHQLPPEPLYLRAKIRQRLSRVGAVALKNAVYALPRREECLEDLQWIAQEAAAGGGEAYVCEASFLEGRTDEALVDQFRAEREAEYRDLEKALGDRAGKAEDLAALLARARKRFDEISRIDFFAAPGRRRVAARLESLSRRGRMPRGPARRGLKGRVWTTRRGAHIDRIASAWLIRRFVDPKARFRFADPKDPARPGELRFDMVGGDYTHEGDRCTFETILARTRVHGRGLSEIAQIVHDVDLKDGKFGRPETAGVERLIAGLVLTNSEDEARLERGFALFDELYQSFRTKSPALSKEVSK
ncbi:MAG TPA: chromate resistance protein ChrB domain-containing protein [Thermoanaerobaculia bacterium]|nr:chromate resistance protein ChrB domain-containing protein [Thermoanaerobaculia bacterium]